jgi:hypothetical protein
MVASRKVGGKYLIAFILTASIFIIGILTGVLVGNYKINKIDSYQRDIMAGVAIRNAQDKLIEQNICDFADASFANKELFTVADRLVGLENDLGTKNVNVIGLKKYYTALEIEEYIYLQKIKQKCGSKNVINLFFYSNEPAKCPSCVDQGYVLTYLRTENPLLRTYSFDVDIDSELVNTLMQKYNITTVPAMVFDDRVYNGFRSKDDLLQILNSSA